MSMHTDDESLQGAPNETPSADGLPADRNAEERAQIERWAEDARMRFENRYERLPSWETGRPQPALTRLEERGWIGERVLDAGCGTGETAMHFAAGGHKVWGIDIAHSAIGIARWRARDRGLPAARFLVGDALSLETLGMDFDTVVDSGLLHAMTDGERAAYVRSVGRVLRQGGMLHVLCFSEHEPGDDGPRRVEKDGLLKSFGEGWEVVELVDERFETNTHKDGARAFRISVRRR